MQVCNIEFFWFDCFSFSHFVYLINVNCNVGALEVAKGLQGDVWLIGLRLVVVRVFHSALLLL